jgi:hypothetical protein
MMAGELEDIFGSLPQDKAKLMAHIGRERAALEQTITGLSETELIRPGPEGWSIKDHLAHLVTWEQILIVHHLQGHSFGEAAQMDEATAAATADMTAEGGLNDYFYERDKNLPLSKVLADFDASYQRVLATLDAMSYDELMRPRPAAEADDPAMQAVVDNTYGHYREHRQIIESLLSHPDGGGSAEK